MTPDDSRNVEAARRYLSALEQFSTGDALAEFFTPDVVQEEFPNRFVPNGARRDLAGILEAAERGGQVMSAQTYDIRHITADGSTVVLEVEWIGTLALTISSLAAGDLMHARFAVVLEYRDGKIVRQRNYDCFEPW